MKKLLAPLVALLFVLAGCSDSSTGGMADDPTPDARPFAENEAQVLGKKGDNGKGKPGGGGDTEAFPTFENIKIEPVNADESLGWFSSLGSDISYSNYVEDHFRSFELGSAGEFFGCPLSDAQCYRITVTLDQAQPDDRVAVRMYPYEQDADCDVNGCPGDMSLDDGTWNSPRRQLSLFDDYLGTPHVPVSQAVDNQLVFYWQGQSLRSSWDGTNSYLDGYFRSDRDLDYGADRLRAAASFVDASSPNTVDGVGLEEIDFCGSGGAMSESNTECVFDHIAPSGNSVMTVELGELSETTQTVGRGRNKQTVTSVELNVINKLDGVSVMDNTGGSRIWVVYLIENEGQHWVESTANARVGINHQTPSAGCLSIKPIQAELYAADPSQFDATFSSESPGNVGFPAYFVVNEGGQLSEDTAGVCTPAS